MTIADTEPREEPAAHVIEALRRVMRDLPGIGKDQRAAREQGGYAYRGIEQITKEAQGLCSRHGVVFAPHVLGEPEVVPITVNGKPWTDTRMLVSYTVYGPGGADDKIEVGPIFTIGRDNSDKGANKCMTQAFKYALLQVFMIADSKDDADGTTVEADDWGTREERGNPRRVATLRADVTPEDVGRMRMAELRERLEGAGLAPGGTLNEMRARLVAHLAGITAGVPAAPPAAESATPTEATEGLLPPCVGCGDPVPLEGEPDQLGVEDDEGGLWHAGCLTARTAS